LLSKKRQLSLRDIEIKNVGVWALAAQVAERFYKGRIVLAGDSAHSFPPAGGQNI
jgi:2-polyprenyl-6-methoxyphenol hydroxylase-like FAD-dependent oxidoreductase